MKEHRQFVRKTVSCKVSVFDNLSQELIGLMVDYSLGGIMVSSSSPLPINEVFELLMVDIEQHKLVKRTGLIKATSIWSDKINSTLYGTGFKLSDVSQDAKAMFKSYGQL